MWELKKQRGKTVLAYSTEWADPQAAADFFKLSRRILGGKWASMEVTVDRDNVLAGRGDDGYFVVRLSGAIVTGLEGLDATGEALAPLR